MAAGLCKQGRYRCLIGSLQVICLIVRCCGMLKLFVCQEAVYFGMKNFIYSLLQRESVAVLGGIMSCCLVRACEIAFSVNLPVFSCAAVHTQVILLISPETLSLKFHSSCISMLHCCNITVHWLWGAHFGFEVNCLCFGRLMVYHCT